MDIRFSLKPPELGMEELYVNGSVDSSFSFYTLVLPTGSGKTLNALRIISAISKELDHVPRRIIYALPFVSLVEQTEKVYKSVLGEESVSSLHHLSLLSDNESVYFPNYQVGVDHMSWYSPVVVTTFVRLWDMLLSRRASAIVERRFLMDSIVILDEVQSFPAEVWKALRKILSYYANRYNTRFILMTATMPYLFSVSDDEMLKVQDVVDIPKDVKLRYYSRRKYHFITNQMSIEMLISRLRQHRKSVLVIVNTREKAYELGDKLGWYVLTSSEPKYIRKLILRHVKEGKIKHLVATQTVEAGADIDFDVVYREMAPVDSIIQSGGRCNRQGRKGEFVVYVFQFEDTEKSFKRVYGNIHWEAISKWLLNLEGNVSELYLLDMLSDITKYVLSQIKLSRADRYLEMGNFSELRKESLIKEYADVYHVLPLEFKGRVVNAFRNTDVSGYCGDVSSLAEYILFGKGLPPKVGMKTFIYSIPMWSLSMPLSHSDIADAVRIDNEILDHLLFIPADRVDRWKKLAMNRLLYGL